MRFDQVMAVIGKLFCTAVGFALVIWSGWALWERCDCGFAVMGWVAILGAGLALVGVMLRELLG